MGSYCGYAVADAVQLHAHTSVQTVCTWHCVLARLEKAKEN